MSTKTRNLIIALAMLVLLCYLAFRPDGGRQQTSEHTHNQTMIMEVFA